MGHHGACSRQRHSQTSNDSHLFLFILDPRRMCPSVSCRKSALFVLAKTSLKDISAVDLRGITFNILVVLKKQVIQYWRPESTPSGLFDDPYLPEEALLQMTPWPAPQFLPSFSLLRSAFALCSSVWSVCPSYTSSTDLSLTVAISPSAFLLHTSSTGLKELDSKWQSGERILSQSPTAKEWSSFVLCSCSTPARCVQF